MVSQNIRVPLPEIRAASMEELLGITDSDSGTSSPLFIDESFDATADADDEGDSLEVFPPSDSETNEAAQPLDAVGTSADALNRMADTPPMAESVTAEAKKRSPKRPNLTRLDFSHLVELTKRKPTAAASALRTSTDTVSR